jgi:16S rRNA (cytosine967-C5)-methyltransferase
MRIHRPLAEGVVNVLTEVFTNDRKASKAIEHILKSNKRWGSRDRSFIAENSYEIIRWWRKLNYINETDGKTPDKAIYWKVFGIWVYLQYDEILSWPEVGSLDKEEITARNILSLKERKYKESIPDWLDKLGDKELGKNWDKMLSALNQQAAVYLRVNTVKTTPNELISSLKAEGIEVQKINHQPNVLKVVLRKNLFSTSAFKNGLFEIQDLGSQMISEYLDVKPGMRVIDACAGAGGKSLHLATLLENKGAIISLDVEDWKLTELRKRARRNGLHNIEARLIENNKTTSRLSKSADRVLLDVPCSGLGVLRRNPDAKWRIDPKFLTEVQQTQKDIFQKYAHMVKDGGQLVYATCSILKSENENQVQSFLSKNPHFELVSEQNVRPYEHDCDGFYMALLKRVESSIHLS